jgi:hypothetical protein
LIASSFFSSSSANSILINASKSILVKVFDEILQEKYFAQDILQTVNSIDGHMQQLNDIVDKEKTSLSPSALEMFKKIKEEYRQMIDYVRIPLQEICDYANGTQTDIDKKLLEALDVVHRQLREIIDAINQNILSKITPWQNAMLMNTDLEEKVRAYMSLAGTILLVLVILLALISLGFFFAIIISRLCNCCKSESSTNTIC